MVAVMGTYAVSGYFAIAVDERSPEGKPELPAVKSLPPANFLSAQDGGLALVACPIYLMIQAHTEE